MVDSLRIDRRCNRSAKRIAGQRANGVQHFVPSCAGWQCFNLLNYSMAFVLANAKQGGAFKAPAVDYDRLQTQVIMRHAPNLSTVTPVDSVNST